MKKNDNTILKNATVASLPQKTTPEMPFTYRLRFCDHRENSTAVFIEKGQREDQQGQSHVKGIFPHSGDFMGTGTRWILSEFMEWRNVVLHCCGFEWFLLNFKWNEKRFLWRGITEDKRSRRWKDVNLTFDLPLRSFPWNAYTI